MLEIKTELLFKIVFDVPSILDVGETPYGRRRIARVAGGTFEGPKMKGRVLDGGGDWLLLRHDGVLQLDVRVVPRQTTCSTSTWHIAAIATAPRT